MPTRYRPTPWDLLVGEGRRLPTLPVAKLRVPASVKNLGGETLAIREGLPGEEFLAPVSPSLLIDFGRLESMDDVVTFAGRSGHLRLCEHAKPFGWDECRPTYSRYFECEVESLALWQLTIDAIVSMQRAALDLASDKMASVADILSVERFFRADVPAWRDPNFAGPAAVDGRSRYERAFWKESDKWFTNYQRQWLVYRLNYWLAYGELMPQYSWRDGRLEIGFCSEPKAGITYISLMGALAIQLAHAVAGTETTAICSACGKPFFAARKRAASRDRYCPACGDAAARRAAKRRYNQRRLRPRASTASRHPAIS
jgi:predicted RNA-binding Zn-ribbon protein involved in translation (DUF1610 family)